MTNLTEFLLARVADDEAWAKMAQDASDVSPWRHGSGQFAGDVFTAAGLRVAETRSANVARHIARHDPARVLAECEAKRRMVEIAADQMRLGDQARGWDNWRDMAEQNLRALAAVYSDHPDYDEAWRP